jgi:uncharacterized protein (TIGR00369 family)
MNENIFNDKDFRNAAIEIFSEKIPFNRFLKIKVQELNFDSIKLSIPMRKELMGHYKRNMLHGGVISSLIDVAGGLCAFAAIQKKLPESSLEERVKKFSKLTTIDMHVSFLRPGTGSIFYASAYIMKAGRKIAVSRIELTNDSNQLIASGTGSYAVL